MGDESLSKGARRQVQGGCTCTPMDFAFQVSSERYPCTESDKEKP